jgi:hypothetical protein
MQSLFAFPGTGAPTGVGAFSFGRGHQRSVAVMREAEAFQKRAIQFNTFAAGAADAGHREFWLRLARSWLELRARERYFWHETFPREHTATSD